MGKRRDTYLLGKRPDDCPHCEKPFGNNGPIKTGAHNGGTGAWKRHCQRCGMIYYDIVPATENAGKVRKDPLV